MLMIFRDFSFLVSDLVASSKVLDIGGEICRWRGRGQRLRRMMDDRRWGFPGSVTISEPGLTNCSCSREQRAVRQRHREAPEAPEAQGEH
jgi:hypothetical protein